jgi:nuclear pore complex protein Nup133
MFTPKRPTSLSGVNSARVTRSQSLKTKSEFAPRLSGIGIGCASPSSANLNDALTEPYKAPLPIRISEFISQSNQRDTNQFSANILTNGHVCFLTEKKVYMWKLRKSYKNIQCNELSLPLSRSRIKPGCVYVECHNNKDYVALCVTCEGTVRYWPSIFNEFLYVDGKIDVSASDEAAQLLLLTRNSFLLITSNGLLWHINVDTLNGQTVLMTKLIDASTGLFSGIGRRVTTFIFGGNVNKNTPSFKSAERYEDSNELFILCDKMLQKWKIDSSSLSLVYQANMERLVYEAYTTHNPDFTKCAIMFHDASITKNSLYVLALVEDNHLRFVVAEVDTHGNQGADLKLKSFHVLEYKLTVRKLDDIQSLYHMHALNNQHAFYLHDLHSIVLFSGPNLEMTGETRFQTPNDKLVACALHERELLFFTLNNGIVKAKDNTISLNIQDDSCLANTLIDSRPSALSQSFGLSSNLNGTSFQDFSNASMLSDESSFSMRASSRKSIDFTLNNLGPDQTALMRFKAAFQLYLRKEENESQAVLNELFQDASLSLDTLCIELSEKLIDDVPLHDARWAELNNKTGKSLNSNLIISNQLNGKLRVHEYFLSFLKAFGLWKKINTCVYANREILTRLALKEHGEKLQCALSMREQLYAKYPDLINSAIEYTIRNREDMSAKLVYPHDVFYRRVSSS